MFEQIKLFFEENFNLTPSEKVTEQQLQLTVAALFLEMMYMDDKVEASEKKLILSLIQENFSLTSEQVDSLMNLAEHQRKQATDYFQFTDLINKVYSKEQKICLLESLWKIAFVDGALDVNEEYLVRKIANLLYIPHTDFIKAKNHVI